MTLQGYYNRFNSAKKYTKSLFRAGGHLQSAELNEVQDYATDAIKRIGDALFADGDVINGCTCVIDNQTGTTTIESGKIYLNGMIRDVHEGSFTIPTDISVRIGIYFKEKTITELEDPELRDPAVGTSGYQQIGAARLQYTTEWAFLSEGAVADSSRGEFYTIYNRFIAK